jgi:hypothetical protein
VNCIAMSGIRSITAIPDNMPISLLFFLFMIQ